MGQASGYPPCRARRFLSFFPARPAEHCDKRPRAERSDKVKKLRKRLRALLPDAALVVGALLVSLGAGMISVAAGLITAGVLLMAGAVIGGDEA